MDELRSVRTQLQALENSLSYVRRLIQGRVDIVGAELQRRRDGGDAGNNTELIGRLPDILAEERGEGGLASVRPPTSMEPNAEVTAQLEAKLEAIIAADHLGNVVEMTPDDLNQGLGSLNDFENEVSVQRRSLHGYIDAVQAEVTRRYTTGEATVDGLLSS